MGNNDEKGFLGRWIWVLLAAALLAGSVFGYFAPKDERVVEQAEIVSETSQLRTELEEVNSRAVQDRNAAVLAVTGQDLSRQAADDEVVSTMLRTATTWQDGASYVTARENVMRRWGLSEDSQFMSTFMPGEAQGAYRTDSSGKVHYAYPDLNSTMSWFQSTLVGIDGDRWTYFGLMQTRTTFEQGSDTNWTAVTYTVDSEGTLSDVSAHPSITDPQRSGS